jgi:hypothetical protein
MIVKYNMETYKMKSEFAKEMKKRRMNTYIICVRVRCAKLGGSKGAPPICLKKDIYKDLSQTSQVKPIYEFY